MHAVVMLMSVTGITVTILLLTLYLLNVSRCLVPSELPDEAKQEIELNRDCNHSSLLNQTASPSLKSTDPSLVSPPPSKGQTLCYKT